MLAADYLPTGITYLNNRHYDPSTGVFLSVDPLVQMTFEPYGYGSANPVTYSDPGGLETCRLDENKQPTVCFDDFEFYVAQKSVQVGIAANVGYDQARSDAGLIPSTDETWMGIRAINQELQNNLAAFYEPGSVSLRDFLFGAGKSAGKSIAAGAAGATAATACAPGGPSPHVRLVPGLS